MTDRSFLPTIEPVAMAAARQWWTRNIATEILEAAPSYIKGDNLVYFTAALKLIIDDPDGFAMHGCDMSYIMFTGHEKKGRKLAKVKAVWREDWKREKKEEEQ